MPHAAGQLSLGTTTPEAGPLQGPRANDPLCLNNWNPHALEPGSHNYWAYLPKLLKPGSLERALYTKRGHHSEKPVHLSEG